MDDALGAFGTSLSIRLTPLAAAGTAGAATLWESLHRAYGVGAGDDSEVTARLAQLFSLLGPSLQPVDAMRDAERAAAAPREDLTTSPAQLAVLATELTSSATALLPPYIVPEWDASRRAYFLPPPLRRALALTVDDLTSAAAARESPPASSSAFGSLSRAPLSMERTLSPATYGLFALSGGCGCSLTHLTVVPLDVVKTRLQTRPGVYAGFADALTTIQREEGTRMLFQGAQATGAGYFAYGVSVYPGYELAKRVLFALAGPTAVLEARVPLVLVAGALATIVTCFLITPFEAVRIRMVECPGYADSFASATRRFVNEGGWASLYDGLIPLLIRQVLFGMVKFLIFDTCADAILAALPPGAGESAAVALGVSLLSGAIAGVGAAMISQPADVVLSKVAQGDGSSGVVGRLPGGVNQLALLQQAGSAIVRQYGLAGLYLGLPSRCLWSGAIIAGQFFLYDVFKGALHVTAQDLTLAYDALGASAAGPLLLGSLGGGGA